ncbi:glycosyl transferase family 28 (plasmid) [Gemmatirosa kalamazoonensis]|uniref:Glycosyl transferase family 28 n=1 Tax=Gemmatirosa kalamazoonensis TaxID=861299 RepID=W0RTF1_9BACT|nr:glycosyltransferase [Gemmatirosa kalamazoonensis]AHG93717.1 glycosyl transferase family 28 [Gemmatirosa kalamazoonensis]
MRVLLSTIGSRGDVQPLVALGLALRALGEEVRLCVPPDFREWIEELGLPVTPIGPELRSTGRARPDAAPPTLEQRRQMLEGMVAAQFETIAAAAEGCDVIVGATVLQIAAPSVAERMGIPYVFAAYCPAVLPSPHHAPPVLGMLGDTPAAADADLAELWAKDARRTSDTWGALLNARRAGLGLTPVADVRGHILTDRPWLAADGTLAPWPDPADPHVFQPGAWILRDERPLAPEIEAFLDAGEPPIYFGFGSIRAPHDLGQVIVESARAHGRRAIVLRGWAELSVADDAADCLVIGEVNQQALFRRVGAVVHHGGAGTTTAAALSGAPQVVVPQMYDQHYWARRVDDLGIGTAHAPGAPTAASLTRALERALQPDVRTRARTVAAAVRTDGADVAARRLIAT